MRLFPILLLSAAAGTSFATISGQQQNPQGQKPTPQSQPAGQTTRTEPASASNKHDDAFLASWVLTVNNNEVALSQLAQQKAQNAEVKQFAQKMVTDHQAVAQKLQAFASAQGLGNQPIGGTGEQPGRPVEAGANRPDTAGKLDHIALVHELGRACLESSRRELESKQGLEFDRCYVNMAIGMHMGMNDMLQVFQNHASGELKTALAEAQRGVQMHLEHAKQLGKRLEGASGSAAGTNPPGSGR